MSLDPSFINTKALSATEQQSSDPNAIREALMSEATAAIESGDLTQFESIVDDPDFHIATQNEHGKTLFHLISESSDNQDSANKIRYSMMEYLLSKRDAHSALAMLDHHGKSLLHSLYEHPSRSNLALQNLLMDKEPVAIDRLMLIRSISNKGAEGSELPIVSGVKQLTLPATPSKAKVNSFIQRLKSLTTMIKTWFAQSHSQPVLSSEDIHAAKKHTQKVSSQVSDQANLVEQIQQLQEAVDVISTHSHRSMMMKQHGGELMQSLAKQARDASFSAAETKQPHIIDEEDIVDLEGSTYTPEDIALSYKPISRNGQIDVVRVTGAIEAKLKEDGYPIGVEVIARLDGYRVAKKDVKKLLEERAAESAESPKIKMEVLGINERKKFFFIKVPSHAVLAVYVNGKAFVIDSKSGNHYQGAAKRHVTHYQSKLNHEDCVRCAVAAGVELCKALPSKLLPLSTKEAEEAVLNALPAVQLTQHPDIKVDTYLDPLRAQLDKEKQVELQKAQESMRKSTD
ncbi:MAG: hypothetical protein ACPGUD_13180 [Parashewanella sp.]